MWVSELDALNEMLATAGEEPVENLDYLPPAANTALMCLRATNKTVQSEGYWFNYETDTTFSPNDEKEIILPVNILAATGIDTDVIKRGKRLYNREAKTFSFSDSINCNVIWQLDWDELPYTAARYITALAVEKFMDGYSGEASITEAQKRNLLRATVAFEEDELRNGKYNLLENESIQQLTRRS